MPRLWDCARITAYPEVESLAPHRAFNFLCSASIRVMV